MDGREPTYSNDQLRGSLTYIGSPLQLSWADLYDDQRGVVLLDPVTLEHELVINPHAIGYVAADIKDVLDDEVDGRSVEGKHVMLVGELSRFRYGRARDKLLQLGARSVRDWRPLQPTLQAQFQGFGATVPASDAEVANQRVRQAEVLHEQAGPEAQGDTQIQDVNREEKGKHPATKLANICEAQPLDLARLAREYIDALELDHLPEARREMLKRVGQHIIQASYHAADTSNTDDVVEYKTLLGAATSSEATKQSTSAEATGVTLARQVFVAQPRLLRITNFLGVQGTLNLDFKKDLPRGLIFLVGGNGAGKSTLFEAIVWCQFGRCVRNGLAVDDIVNDVVRKNCSVSLEFENGYTITRYRKDKSFKNRVVVSLNGKAVTQFEKPDQRNTQAAINELLGVDYDTFVRTVVLGHESTASFLSSTASQRRDVIETLLGLSVLDICGDVSLRMLRQVDADTAKLQISLDGLAQKIQYVEDRCIEYTKTQERLKSEKEGAIRTFEAALEQQGRRKLAEKHAMETYQKDQEDQCRLKEAEKTVQVLADLDKQISKTQKEVGDLTVLAKSAELRNAVDRDEFEIYNQVRGVQKDLAHLKSTVSKLEGHSTDFNVKSSFAGRLRAFQRVNRLRIYIELCLYHCERRDRMREDVGSHGSLYMLANTIAIRLARTCLIVFEKFARTLKSIEDSILGGRNKTGQPSEY